MAPQLRQLPCDTERRVSIIVNAPDQSIVRQKRSAERSPLFRQSFHPDSGDIEQQRWNITYVHLLRQRSGKGVDERGLIHPQPR